MLSISRAAASTEPASDWRFCPMSRPISCKRFSCSTSCSRKERLLSSMLFTPSREARRHAGDDETRNHRGDQRADRALLDLLARAPLEILELGARLIDAG